MQPNEMAQAVPGETSRYRLDMCVDCQAFTEPDEVFCAECMAWMRARGMWCDVHDVQTRRVVWMGDTETLFRFEPRPCVLCAADALRTGRMQLRVVPGHPAEAQRLAGVPTW